MIKKKLGRKAKHRKQTLINLASAIVLYEKVTTTQAKAKAVIPIIEQAINTAKKNDLTSRRKLLANFGHNKKTVNKIITDIAPRFKNSASGFVKLFNSQPRHGDNAPMTTIILSKSKFLGNLEVQKSNDEGTKSEKLKNKSKVKNDTNKSEKNN